MSEKAIDYVALGDSFTSGAGILPASNADCGQSSRNYPHLLAKEFATIRLQDASCAGARTENLDNAQLVAYHAQAPLQFDGLGSRTDLVTVSIGANDDNAFGTLVGACAALGTATPRGFPCSSQHGDLGAEVHRELTGTLIEKLSQAKKLAPQARIVVVGYPQFVPFDSRCEAYPVAYGDIAWAHRVNTALNESLRDAAAASAVEFLDTAALTHGHDLCSADPWVRATDPTGLAPQPTDGEGDHAHPTPAYHRAVASALADLLASPPPALTPMPVSGSPEPSDGDTGTPETAASPSTAGSALATPAS